MAQVRWKRLFFQTTMWLLAEVCLTCIGIDDLADYSEFHFIYRDDVITRLKDGICLKRLVAPAG